MGVRRTLHSLGHAPTSRLHSCMSRLHGREGSMAREIHPITEEAVLTSHLRGLPLLRPFLIVYRKNLSSFCPKITSYLIGSKIVSRIRKMWKLFLSTGPNDYQTLVPSCPTKCFLCQKTRILKVVVACSLPKLPQKLDSHRAQ